MKKFVAIFNIPVAALDAWMTTIDEATRKQQTNEMMQAWNSWMEEHKGQIIDKGLPLGKTKRLTSEETRDTRNDMMWYLVAEADSHDDAATLFAGHPHLQIPSSYIEIMDASRPM